MNGSQSQLYIIAKYSIYNINIERLKFWMANNKKNPDVAKLAYSNHKIIINNKPFMVATSLIKIVQEQINSKKKKSK